MAGGIVIQEKQGLGTRDHQIVDTHCHQVDTNGVMAVQVHGQLQLGSHPVGARHQYRFPVAGRQLKQGAKSPQTRHHFRASGAARHALDTFYQGITGGDVHTGVFVTEGILRRVSGIAHESGCNLLKLVKETG